MISDIIQKIHQETITVDEVCLMLRDATQEDKFLIYQAMEQRLVEDYNQASSTSIWWEFFEDVIAHSSDISWSDRLPNISDYYWSSQIHPLGACIQQDNHKMFEAMMRHSPVLYTNNYIVTDIGGYGSWNCFQSLIDMLSKNSVTCAPIFGEKVIADPIGYVSETCTDYAVMKGQLDFFKRVLSHSRSDANIERMLDLKFPLDNGPCLLYFIQQYQMSVPTEKKIDALKKIMRATGYHDVCDELKKGMDILWNGLSKEARFDCLVQMFAVKNLGNQVLDQKRINKSNHYQMINEYAKSLPIDFLVSLPSDWCSSFVLQLPCVVSRLIEHDLPQSNLSHSKKM